MFPLSTGAGAISDEGLQQYMKSIAHFKEETKKAKVDVELQNHPLFDDFTDKLGNPRAAKRESPIPSSSARQTIRSFWTS